MHGMHRQAYRDMRIIDKKHKRMYYLHNIIICVHEETSQKVKVKMPPLFFRCLAIIMGFFWILDISFSTFRFRTSGVFGISHLHGC